MAKINALLASIAEDLDDSAKRIALLANLLSLPVDAYRAPTLTPQVRKTNTIALLAGILDRLARREPLLGRRGGRALDGPIDPGAIRRGGRWC